jgi:membrane protein insertase Oxa1/YidC/SpoIIIJ/rhodanese-related sulfurtransferase/phosphohistidine swiveling domain-containing protein
VRTHTVNRRRQQGVYVQRLNRLSFRRRLGGILLFAAGFSVAPPALAIPSPDLVVNLSASVAQILGLVTVVFGGLAVSSRRKGGAVAVRHATAWRWAALALSVSFLIALAGNIFQYTRHKDADNRRLHTNLVRASVEAGQKVGDTSLKTLSFSGQLAHPRGLHTDELSRQLQAGRALNLIDVREPEEVEAGRIAGSTHIRYPDLRGDPSGLLREGMQNVLLCYSGNRSSELCDGFTEQGYACNFMIGGYEKWLAEGRPLQGAASRAPKQLRELPDYANKATLLDTPEATRLVQDEGAIFVDVRYPGDFEANHLPGAINIALRKQTSDEMWSRLKSLPNQPIIAPCYDKRSCFYASILGLRVTRLGYDFRGRYTVPHEYSLPGSERTHVSQWLARQQDTTLLSLVATPLSAVLDSVRNMTGSLIAAIALLAFALRVLFVPVTLKAERDQLMQASLAPEIKALREQLADDSQRLSRAVMGLYRKANLTPVRNLIGSLAQLVLFLVFFSVVNRAGSGSDESLLWIPALGSPDPAHVLPAVVGALLFGYLSLMSSRRRAGLLAAYVLGAGLMAYLLAGFNAAVNLYLLLSLALMLLQSVIVRHVLKPTHARALPSATSQARGTPGLASPGIVALSQAHRVPGAGNKAIRLARLMAAGLPVPDGFCVTSELLGRHDGSGNQGLRIGPEAQRELFRFWARLGADKVAVRSSGLNEDGARQSYAGMFESKLKVTRAELLSSLQEVGASMHSARASVYSGNRQEAGGALVQKMVDAEFAGVLFTEHPASCGLALVELVAGLGESLVSGKRTPQAYCFGWASRLAVDGKTPPIDLRPLLELGNRVESLFGQPQDIEWVYAKGRFFLLQARDITCSIRDGSAPRNVRERERHRLLRLAAGVDPQAPVFEQDALSELLPQPTPFSASFVERFWAPGGSTDLACRELGIAYDVHEFSPPYVNTVYGALYVNRQEGNRRVRRGAGALASFRLARSAEAIEQRYREQFLPDFLTRVRIQAALDFDRLTVEELLGLWENWVEAFITRDYVQTDIINVAADFYWKMAARKLAAADIDPAHHLGRTAETVVHKAMSMLPAIRTGERKVEEFLALFGHRAPEDYEFQQARYAEDPALVQRLIDRAQESERSAPAPAFLPGDTMLALAVRRAENFQVLKEEAKHNGLRAVVNLRRLLLALDERLQLDQGIFYLRLEELSGLRQSAFRDQARELIASRRREAEIFRDVRLPSSLSIQDLERSDSEFATVHLTDSGNVLRGVRVAGQGGVVGPVRLIHDPQDIDSFKEGQVLVARFTDPTWTPLFTRARGVITEVGGWLSHAAIVAREYDITAIVGAVGSAQQLKNGELVRLNADGTIDRIENRRRDERCASGSVVYLRNADTETEATIRDFSCSGLCVETREPLEPGRTIGIRLAGTDRDVAATVVRQAGAGAYGLHFARPLDAARSMPVGSAA